MARELATEYFEAYREMQRCEHEVMNEVCEIIRGKTFDTIDVEDLGFEDFVQDDYDCSFELLGCDDDITLSPDQLKRLWALGYMQLWLNHKNGMETHYHHGSDKGYVKESIRGKR